MGLNKSKGNMYGFVTHTWNTIKGKCFHDCIYCYMKRWPNLHTIRLDKKELNTDLSKKNFIFVGSSCDMFADNVPKEWIRETLHHCRKYDNRYLFQSKNPFNFHEHQFPENTWLCTTLESNRFYSEIMRYAPPPGIRAMNLGSVRQTKVVTIEPIMKFDLKWFLDMIRECKPYQVNIGADSGGNNLPEPSGEEVKQLIAELKKFTKVYLKDNLKRLYHE